jgi:bacillithiol biosynthesis cysteine-adding enzyme BshC
VAERIKIVAALDRERLPGTSALFGDYLARHEKVAEFFPADPRALTERFDPQAVLTGRTFDRAHLADILERQNLGWSASGETMAAIERLRRPDVLTVVTGQQVGLFTGPLYAVYKALSVLQLTRALRGHLGDRFVPLFWMAAGDHDLAEVDHAVLPNRDGRPVTIRLAGDYLPDHPVGDLSLGPGIAVALGRVRELLPENEFRDGVMELLSSAYRPDRTFAAGFARVLLALFAGQGLILVDPTDAELTSLCRPLFERELALAPATAGLVIERGRELTGRGYHAQLQLIEDQTNLFLIDEGRRRGLIVDGDGFRLRGTDRILSGESLRELLQEAPHRFSPNAALRPLMEDDLFPVAAYVAGPSETAYLAQLGPLYERLGVPRPPVYPRMSLTLLEGHLGRVLLDSGMDPAEIFAPADRLAGRLSERHLPADLEADIDAAGTDIDETLRRLAGRITGLEPTMAEYLTSVSGKIRHQLGAVRKKLLQARRARDRTLRRRAIRLGDAIYPQGHLQERVTNIVPFLARHGTGLIERLDALQIDPWQHQVITLSED